MERLTRRFGDKIVQENDSISQWLWIDQVLKRLCDYEDSGMTPEEVWEAKKERQKSKSAPLEVGDTIYRLATMGLEHWTVTKTTKQGYYAKSGNDTKFFYSVQENSLWLRNHEDAIYEWAKIHGGEDAE